MDPIPFSGDDALRLTSFNSASSVRLALGGRFRTPDGKITAFVHEQVPNADRTTLSSSFPLGAGELLNAHVFATGGSPRIGQCFAIVEIVRGLGSAFTPLAVLFQGYVTDTQKRGWPGSMLEASTAGRGVLRSVTGTNPAAGVEVSETVPTNARWKIHALAVSLATSAVAGNRLVDFVLDDGANIFYRFGDGQNHAASTTRLHSAGHAHATFLSSSAAALAAIPIGIELMGGHRIRTITTALDAGDDYGAPQLLVEEFIED